MNSLYPTHEYPHAKRFLRQLLLQRYAELLKKLQTSFHVSEEHMKRLRDQILTVDWVDQALDPT
jgi:hypothetical protein